MLTKWLLAPALAILFALGAVGSSGAGDWSTIRIGTEGVYAPFSYRDAAGRLSGFDIDIAQALCDRIGAKCSFVTLPYDGMIPALQNGQIDLVDASMSITEKRRKVVDFVDRYYTRYARFLSCTAPPVGDAGPGAMKGRPIGTQAGTVNDDYLEAVYKESDLRLYKSMDEAYQDAAAGRLDAVLAGEAVSYAFMQSEAGKGCKFVSERVVDDRFYGGGVGMALRKTDGDLRDKLNAALKQILADGTYAAINKKYFPFSIY